MRNSVGDMTQRLCQDNTGKHFETFLACRLIPLNKKPGVRPIGIGQVSRRTLGKAVMKLSKKMF